MPYHGVWQGRLWAPAIAAATALCYLPHAAHAKETRSADNVSGAQPDGSDTTPASESGPASGGSPAATLPIVTVAASKRSQSLQSINGAAVVVERSLLDDAQVENTLDLARVLPGVQMSQNGSMLFPTIGLRGITSAQDFYNPALTVYVDGVPQLPVFTAQTLLDVDRVELLKGPQGTLYGKSAEGGVLNIVTTPPDNDPRLHLRAGASSRNGYVAQGEAAGPLVKDLLYGSVSLTKLNSPGDLTNPVTGAEHQGGTHSLAGTARLRLAPTGALWEVNLSAGRDCATGSQDAYVPFDDIGSRTAYIMPGLPASDASFRQHRCANSYSLSGRYHFGQWRLTAISAWQTVHIARHFPFGPYFSEQPENWRQNVQELRLATHAPGRPWDAVFGLYRQQVHQSRTYTNDLSIPAPLNVATTASDNHSQALAAYGDVTWHATHALDLSAGLRVSRDKASTHFAGSTPDYATYMPVPFSGSGRTDGNRVLGKVSAGYQIDPNWRVYANISQGYKPAGFNLAPSSPADAQGYRSERMTSYEIGARLTGSSVRGALALYRIHTNNAQLYSTNMVGYQTLRNVGDTHSTGVEADVEWDATRQWTVGLNGFLDHASFSRYTDPYGCSNCSGNWLPFAPRYGLTLNLKGKVPTQMGAIRPQLAVRWLGAQYFDTANTLRQASYAVVDASLGWRVHPDVEVTGYVHNLTDRDYRTYAFSGGPMGNFAQVGLRRTVGVMVSYDY